MEAAPAEAPVQAVGSAKLRQSLLLRAASFEGASSDWRPSLRSGPATGSSQAWQVDADEVAMMGQFSPDDVATVLHQSARNGHLEVFQTVLSKIMDPKSGQILVDTIDADGNNLLHTAAACGAFQVVDWLLGAGGEQEMIYGLNNYKQTPLHVACGKLTGVLGGAAEQLLCCSEWQEASDQAAYRIPSRSKRSVTSCTALYAFSSVRYMCTMKIPYHPLTPTISVS